MIDSAWDELIDIGKDLIKEAPTPSVDDRALFKGPSENRSAQWTQ
jgi:hypothetical protein